MSSSNSDANVTPITTPVSKSSGGRSKSVRSGSARTGRFWLITITGSLIVLFLSGIVFFFGQVEGREFAPSHFQIRRFSFTEIPLLRLQITPIKRVSETSTLQSYLATSSMINRPAAQPSEWHLIELTRFGVSSDPADAKLLTDFLSIPYYGFARRRGVANQSNLYWHQWSTQNPKHAAVLWPEIQKLAERELYLLIPDVFQIADAAVPTDSAVTPASATGAKIAAAAGNTQSTAPSTAQSGPATTAVKIDPRATAESVEAMRARLRQFLIASYVSLIEDMRAAGMDDVAESLLQEAASDYPDEARFQAAK